MDYQYFVDHYKPMTCILSVEKKPDGGYGTIRIAAGNAAYIASIEDPHQVSSSEMLDNKFIPGSEYTKYIPKDLTFEDLCYSAAILGKPIHTYSRPERYPFWLNVFILPLLSDDPNVGYCAYTLELHMQEDSTMRTDLSAETMSEVLNTCIKLRSEGDIKEIFKEIVGDIGRLCDSDHCCILTVDHAKRRCRVLGEFIKEGSGLLPMQTYLDDSFYDITQTWNDTIAGSTCFVATDSGDMEVLRERNPVWHASLTGAGATSIVLFPLQHGGETLGYMWAINFDTENVLKIMKTLELTTYFIASEIDNILLVERLQIMSSVDLLTGVKNRNAMNTRIDEIVGGVRTSPPCGVIFTDINGLKYTNDHLGHNAGDELIKKAAKRLEKLCPDMEIYRAGGDEFMIIVSGMDEDGFNELLAKIREPCGGVIFAAGGCYGPGLDIRTAIHIADEQMYIDKERYYKNFPDRKR